MPKRKSKRTPKSQPDLLDVTAKLRTGPCVPALREAVKAWQAGGYKGTTETTRRLLNFWFETDHKLSNGRPFKYHHSQREAIETLIFVWEYEKVRTRKALLERYATSLKNLRLPTYDEFARYCIKMATGSGKTKVMSLVVAWQFFNAQCEEPEEAKQYAKTFLVIAPNVIVFERLKTDFEGGRIFRIDPIIPKFFEIFWDFDTVMRHDGQKAHSEGMLFLSNIQQFYERLQNIKYNEPEEMTAVLGTKPSLARLEVSDFSERIGLRSGNLMVINDEAHHTHDEESEWNTIIRRFHQKTPIAMRVDFSATPRFQKGQLFPWVISDYPLKQAILDGIVKRPFKGIAHIQEAKSKTASVRYKGFLVAGVERWREYKEQLGPLKKKPILFVMLNDTDEADDVGDWLQTKYPKEFGEDKTLVIHTDKSGEVSKADLDKARIAAHEVDDDQSPVNAIVSVLMLREGWDVQNVTVVVGLRPYTAKANILPEQTIGRGLRLMFRGHGNGYTERVDVIGNNAFISFVDDLEKLEDIKLDSFDVGKDKLSIVSIMVDPDKKKFDIGLPVISPVMVRKKSLAEEIAELDVMRFQTPKLPIKKGDSEETTFAYEGFDYITLVKEVERKYTIPEPQTPQEVIGYYARQIAQEVKLPSQFAALVPRIKEFFEKKAFGRTVNLEETEILKAMTTNVSQYVCVQAFKKELQSKIVSEQTPKIEGKERLLSDLNPPFPWGRPVYESKKTILNLVPCDNEFERTFAKFLDKAKDVKAFSKIPQSFGFSIDYVDGNYNQRSYHPDFAAIAEDGTNWLLETKGQEGEETKFKDAAAERWCENATTLTKKSWRYKKIPQKKFMELEPDSLADIEVI
jgi:type III restriction enzyme